MDTLVLMLLPVIGAILGRYFWEGVQVVGNFVDFKLAPQIHAVALVVIQFLLIQAAQALGMPLPETLNGFTPEIATAAITAAMAMGWHKLSAKKA